MKQLKILILSLSILLASQSIFSQIDAAFKYQAVARTVSGQILKSQSLGVKVNILESGNTTSVFEETHDVMTSDLGIFVLTIGQGENQNGSLSSLSWNAEKYNLLISIDQNGGTNYIEVGQGSEILGVPLAIHANQANTALDDEDKNPSNELQSLIVDGLKIGLSDDPNSTSLIDLTNNIQNNINIDDGDSDPLNEFQTLFRNGNMIELSNNGGSIADRTQDADADSTNEIQKISKQGDTVTLDKDGGSFIDEVDDADSDPVNEIQEINLTGTTLSISDGNSVELGTLADGDADATNEIQELSLDGTILSISNGNTVELESLSDADGDATNELQSLIVDGLLIGITNDPNNPELFDLSQQIENNIDINDADSDPQNEIQTLSLVVDTLFLSDGNQVVLPSFDDNDSDPQNEIQSLSLAGDTLSIDNSNFIILPFSSDADHDPQNEIQSLSLAGDTLSIDDSNFVVLPSVNDYDSDPQNELQNLSILGNELSLSDGNSITLPSVSGNSPWIEEVDTVKYMGNVFASNEKIKLDNDFHGAGRIKVLGENGLANVTMESYSDHNNGDFGNLSIYDQTAVFRRVEFGVEPIDNQAYGRLLGPNNLTNISLGGGAIDPNVGVVSTFNAAGALVALLRGKADQAGAARVYGPQGSRNVSMESMNNHTGRGVLAVYDETGESLIRLDIFRGTGEFATNQGRITADMMDISGGINCHTINATVKNFRMDHPKDDNKEIWYACIEGPEAGAYERGQIMLINGEAYVDFTNHFSEVIIPDGMTIALTPHDPLSKGLCAYKRTEKGFKIKELFNGKGTYIVDWEVKSIRKGFEDYKVIRDKVK